MDKNISPKERIIETATRLFYNQGYNNTGINQILEEAQVAKASLYLHFGSKEVLGEEYLKAARVEWFDALEKWTIKKKTPVQKALACFDFLEYALRINEFRGCKFINMLTELADSNSNMQKQILEHKAKLRNYIKHFVNESLVSVDIARKEIIGDAVYLLFEGAIVESKIYKDAWPVKSAKKLVKTLLEG
jgi:AcrR family transcriptional regulator